MEKLQAMRNSRKRVQPSLSFDQVTASVEELERTISLKYRLLLAKIKENDEELKNNPELRDKLMAELNELFKSSPDVKDNDTSVAASNAVMDSKILRKMVVYLRTYAEEGNPHFNIPEFATNLLQSMGAHETDEGELFVTLQHWTCYGSTKAHIFRQASCLRYLLGSLPTADDLNESTESSKQRRLQLARPSKEEVIPTTFRLLNSAKNTEERVKNISVEADVEKVMEILQRAYAKSPEKIALLSFAMDPTSFSRSVRNCFYLSILVKERRVTLVIKDDIPYLRPKTLFAERRFDETSITDKEFQQRYRVPRSCVDFLEQRFFDALKFPTQRNNPLSPREQILVFLHFLGTNSFYHVMRDCHGIGTDTVFRCVHRVCEVLFQIRNQFICWPAHNLNKIAEDFYDMASMPSVCGCVDGSHFLVTPEKDDEASFVNRHHSHSINAVVCCGPDLTVYYANCSAPGAWHDSHVLKETNLWNIFEAGHRPFPGAVILADSAYVLNDWLITPFPGDPAGAKLKFNIAHMKTRNTVERCFGALKNRFFVLKNGMRVIDMDKAGRLAICCIILHNLAIKHGDNINSEDFLNPQVPQQQPPNSTTADPTLDLGREGRRNLLLQSFI